MRTTIEFNKSTLTKVRMLQIKRDSTLSKTVNDLVEIALAAEKAAPKKKFKITPRKMGFYEHLDYSNTGKLLEVIEGPLYK